MEWLNYEIVALCAVLITPLIFTPKRLANPYFLLAGNVVLFFVLKYVFNTIFNIDFLLDVEKTDIDIELWYFIAYITTAYLTSMLFIYMNNIKHINFSYTYLVNNKAYFTSILLPIALVLIVIFAMDINPLIQSILVRRFTQAKGMFYILAVILFLINLMVVDLLQCIFLAKKRPPSKLIFATIICFGYAVISGYASTIVSGFICFVIFMSAYKKLKVELYVVLIMPLIMLYAVIHNQFRLLNLNDKISFIEIIGKININAELLVNIFNRFDYLEMYVKGHQLVKTMEPDMGLSMLTAIIQFIPRAFWPDKPLNTSSFFSNQIIPNVMEEAGSTANFNSLNEFSRSLGPISGVLVGGVLFGLLLGWAYLEYRKSLNDQYCSLYYSLIVCQFITLGFSAGFINDVAIQVFIINLLLFKIFISRQNVNPLSQ
ncbi:MAG: hypothetical protein HZA10_02720 [Nitrospirae bacterium]|nr:hypothetical protein [Nitrospirota bacterium]